MIRITQVILAIIRLLLLLLSLKVIVEGNSTPVRVLLQDVTNNDTSSSPWLKNGGKRPPGCWKTPWVCRQGGPPGTRMRCCRNVCVDVANDVNNCGLCGIRCPFAWQCCRGICVNTNISPLNCGRCGNRCPWEVACVYGMCGYAQPDPQPWPPRPPKPPKPWPPKKGEPQPPPTD